MTRTAASRVWDRLCKPNAKNLCTRRYLQHQSRSAEGVLWQTCRYSTWCVAVIAIGLAVILDVTSLRLMLNYVFLKEVAAHGAAFSFPCTLLQEEDVVVSRHPGQPLVDHGRHIARRQHDFFQERHVICWDMVDNPIADLQELQLLESSISACINAEEEMTSVKKDCHAKWLLGLIQFQQEATWACHKHDFALGHRNSCI